MFFPAVLACVRALYGPDPSTRRVFALAATLLNPAAIIIDHGHFQVCVKPGPQRLLAGDVMRMCVCLCQ